MKNCSKYVSAIKIHDIAGTPSVWYILIKSMYSTIMHLFIDSKSNGALHTEMVISQKSV